MPPILCSMISRAASSTPVSDRDAERGLDHDIGHGDLLQHGGQEHLPQIPGGEPAHHAAAFQHRQVADLVLVHQSQGLTHLLVGGDGDDLPAHNLADPHPLPLLTAWLVSSLEQAGNNFNEIGSPAGGAPNKNPSHFGEGRRTPGL